MRKLSSKGTHAFSAICRVFKKKGNKVLVSLWKINFFFDFLKLYNELGKVKFFQLSIIWFRGCNCSFPLGGALNTPPLRLIGLIFFYFVIRNLYLRYHWQIFKFQPMEPMEQSLTIMQHNLMVLSQNTKKLMQEGKRKRPKTMWMKN